MKAKISPSSLGGEVLARNSKSHAHRLLLAAALGDGPSQVLLRDPSEDIEASLACLLALGASLEPGGWVWPIKKPYPQEVDLYPGESGTTFRLLVPLLCALGIRGRFHLEGSLYKRPMEDLYQALEAHGVTIRGRGSRAPSFSGQLQAGTYRLRGDISSQFFSGLAFALPLLEGPSLIEIVGPLKSKPYLDMTLEVLGTFGLDLKKEGSQIAIRGGQSYQSPGRMEVEGDWSNGAFWLGAGLFSKEGILVRGLDPKSCQGDRQVVAILRQMGGHIREIRGGLLAQSSQLRGLEIDGSHIPDLVPVLALVASLAQGQTKIYGIGQLRYKESHRLETIGQVLRDLGGRVQVGEDWLLIEGVPHLKGGRVKTWGDHRLVMMGALGGSLAQKEVLIEGAQAVNKSYPKFFQDLKALGGQVTIGG